MTKHTYWLDTFYYIIVLSRFIQSDSHMFIYHFWFNLGSMTKEHHFTVGQRSFTFLLWQLDFRPESSINRNSIWSKMFSLNAISLRSSFIIVVRGKVSHWIPYYLLSMHRFPVRWRSERKCQSVGGITFHANRRLESSSTVSANCNTINILHSSIIRDAQSWKHLYIANQRPGLVKKRFV